MINMRKATPDDVIEAVSNAKPIFEGEKDLLKNALGHCYGGRVYSLYDDNGNIGCIFGVVPLWTGVVDVWTVVTYKIDLQPIAYVRCLLRFLEVGMKRDGIHRVGIQCKTNDPTVHKWARVLGFKEEGIMKKYGTDGEDYTSYGRVL